MVAASPPRARREGTVEVVDHVLRSSIVAVPPSVVVRTLRDIESIKRYGVDGRMLNCCVMESTVPPTEVGAVRRCTLRVPPYTGTLVRERLVRSCDNVHAPKDDTVAFVDAEEDAVRVAEVVLEYVPCTGADRHRSPLEPAVEDVLCRAVTTFRVCGVTHSANRCYVQAVTEVSMEVHHGLRVALDTKLQDNEHRRGARRFWETYLDAQLRALEAHVVKEVYRRLDDRVPAEFSAAFGKHEETLCSWAASTADVLPKTAVVDELEALLVWWSRALVECEHQRLLAEAAQRVSVDSDAAAAPLRRERSLVASSPSPTGHRSDTSRGASSPTVSARVGIPFASSGASADGTLPRFRSQIINGAAGSATTGTAPMAQSLSQSSGLSDSHHVSVPSPRDRRHTAVPKRSMVTAAGLDSLADGLPPVHRGYAMATTPVSLASLSASPAALPATMSTMTVLGGGLAQRRRSAATHHSPHLLSRPQQRASPSLPKDPRPSSATAGLFFSQLFTPSRPVAVSSVAAAASAAPPPAAAVPPEPAEVFQPALVRHLFSLTGVLQQDVARRLFLSLADDTAAATPYISRAALRRVLQCVDPCGLRESYPRRDRQAAAAAEEEAYRAEVRRCYHEQNALAGASMGGADDAVRRNASGSAASTSANTSTLTHLTARQQAARHAAGDAALDRLVGATLTRFSFHAKSMLTYEEFCLALLHLWKS
ncbi:hypothetical protein NESM_000196900 [Novymonas esmeraldas]|uniref:Uncharacterized protein n=1 Tax=Novymonas esmeraldas TaxID=1808958 RepID=A0AAW0F699_9TRYP